MDVKMEVFQREEIPLSIIERQEKGKGPVGRLRRNDAMLPGVVYGHNQKPLSFKVAGRSLERALSQGGQNAIFMLQQEGASGEERAVVREIQYHKVNGSILHVDLLRIDPGEELRVQVPIVTLGVPVGVHTGGGGLQQSLTQLEMRCLASELPSRIEIDISDLEIGQNVHVSDLLEKDPRIMTEGEVTIVSVLSPRLTVDEELALAAEEEEEEIIEGEEALAEAEEAGAEAPADGEGDAGGEKDGGESS